MSAKELNSAVLVGREEQDPVGQLLWVFLGHFLPCSRESGRTSLGE